MKAGLALLALGLALAVLIPACETSRVHLDRCTACFAQRETTETGLWYGRRRLVEGTTTVAEKAGSPVLREFLGEGHAHRWRFGSTAFKLLGMNHGFACLTPRFNPIASAIANDDGFRSFVGKKVVEGSLSRGDLVALLELPPFLEPEERSDPGLQAKVERGRTLLQEGGRHDRWAWSEVMALSPPR